MANRFLSCVSLVALLVAVNCGRRAESPTVASQNNDNSCVRKIDLQLIAAALRDNDDDLEAAIKSGANVDVILESLGPALVILTSTGNYRGVKLLLDNGANVNAADPDGYTAILIAALNDRRDIATLLVKNGADVNAPASFKVKGNASIKVKDNASEKLTPLLIAKHKGYQEMVQLLTAAGAKE